MKILTKKCRVYNVEEHGHQIYKTHFLTANNANTLYATLAQNQITQINNKSN